MNLQSRLREIPAHNGHIAYHFRDGKYTYFLGYGADKVVTFESSVSHDQWSDEELDEIIELFKAESSAPPKSEPGDE